MYSALNEHPDAPTLGEVPAVSTPTLGEISSILTKLISYRVSKFLLEKKLRSLKLGVFRL